MIFLGLILLWGCQVILADNQAPNIVPEDEEIYKALYKHKRAEQLDAVHRIMTINDYAKKFKLVTLATEQIAKVMTNAKVVLESSGYVPGEKFPENIQVREALANVLENTPLIGEILLRLPDITHKVLDTNNEVRLLTLWSLGFCQESPLIDAHTKVLLHLMAQEMNLVPRDPNYVNPYKIKHETKKEQVKEKEKLKEKPKKKKTRGPQLSGVRQEL